jgi:hypothetical protein
MEAEWYVLFPPLSVTWVLIQESDLLNIATTVPVAKLEPVVDPPKPEDKFEMTAEEERELAELLDSD